MALALCGVIRGYTVAYTLPTAGFAATFMKTRVDPVIQNSPYLKDMLSGELDNTEVKKLGDSFLYLRGAQSSNAPISVPCDHLIHDEVDFSDPEVLSQYQSRLTHSKYKRKTKLSTPTLPDRGIDYEFQRSRRKFNFVKCSCCSQYFLPDYFKHVRVPGFTGDLRTSRRPTSIMSTTMTLMSSALIVGAVLACSWSTGVGHREPWRQFCGLGYSGLALRCPEHHHAWLT
jgi:hypothetical protein